MDASTKKNTAPPAYSASPEDELATQTERLALNDLDTPTSLPNVQKVIAHLELLHAIHSLRNDVSNHDGLFDLYNEDVGPTKGASNEQAQSPLVESLKAKRWAVFVARAEDRFRAWWSSLRKKSGAAMLRLGPLSTKAYFNAQFEPKFFKRVITTKDDLPPLGRSSLAWSVLGLG